MVDLSKITPAHRQRLAIVYVRQSSPGQVQRNPESTARQYEFVTRALELGWQRHQVVVIDEDQGTSANGIAVRSGFGHLTAEVALGHVGIILGLELSRLARNNADWYRLLDLCGITNALLADDDGLYHPGDFNDRLVLGLKSTMSEAELHVLRSRLDGGIRHKAARGELRRGLPVGLVWGEQDGEVRLHPDEAITGAIRTVFDRFGEFGSARRVWLWFCSEKLDFPLQMSRLEGIRWVVPTYTAIHNVLTNPVYAGAYVYGKTRTERFVDASGRVGQRTRHLPRTEWAVLLPNHHPGFITWEEYLTNLERINSNTRPRAHQPGGAIREGAALLQGLATCGRCGRRLAVHYRGRHSSPGYHCPAGVLVNGRGTYCQSLAGRVVDEAVVAAFLAACTPAGLQAAVAAAESLASNFDASLAQWRLEVERTRYEASRAERRYRAVDPENRLVARGLERDWEQQLAAVAAAERELEQREHRRPQGLTAAERAVIQRLGKDLGRVWSAPTTTDRDRKELLRTLLAEVLVNVDRPAARVCLTLRWRGGALTELQVPLPRPNYRPLRTDEDTLALLRRLATHYPDGVIAGILNRQGRRSARGERFTTTMISSLRTYWDIPCFKPPTTPPNGELVTVTEAARRLQIAPSTLLRWLQDGFIGGEQITPGAPWCIRLNDELRARFVDEAPPGWLPMQDATKALGVSRQTVMQRVKRGELRAVHVYRGRRKGLRIEVPATMNDLFSALTGKMGVVC
ncbi:MAG: recombinase family protein [Chloroflexi bacterium]|nr:MAG: recombinase family protein [Chloroflexota bacterium]